MMKKIFFLFALIAAVALSACGPRMYNTQSSGKDNVSYVIVVKDSRTDYRNVAVVVDDVTYPYGIVYKLKAKRKALPIIIEPGRHNVKVVVDGTTITDENVFLGLQETKMIILR